MASKRIPSSMFQQMARRKGPSSGEVGRYGLVPSSPAPLLMIGVVSRRSSFSDKGAVGVSLFLSSTRSSKLKDSGFESGSNFFFRTSKIHLTVTRRQEQCEAEHESQNQSEAQLASRRAEQFLASVHHCRFPHPRLSVKA